MAALNFPDPNVQTSYTNPDTGIAYEWANGLWKAVRTAQTAPELFVDADGDNLTGNLTLGTDKIVLDATTGAATFASNVTSGGNIQGFAVIADQPVGTYPCFSAKLSGSQNAVINADGSASFGVNTSTYQTGVNIFHDSSDNTALTIYSKGSSTARSFVVYDNSESGANKYRATINQDGSASFADRVDIGSSSLNDNAGLKVVNNYAASGAATVRVQNFNDAGQLWSGRESNNNETSAIFANGSATFAGEQNINTSGTAGYLALYRSNGGAHPTLYIEETGDSTGVPATSSILRIAKSGNGSSIRAMGSADFAGNVQVGSSPSTGNGITAYESGQILIRKDGAVGTAFEVFSDGSSLAYRTVEVKNDGSATFQGNGKFFRSLALQNGYGAGMDGGAALFTRNFADDTTTAMINYDGSAIFTGTINGTTVGTSDIKFKENIEAAPAQLADIEAFELKTFDWKDEAPMSDELKAQRKLGLIAQEVEAICPEMVYEVAGQDDDSYKAINHDVLIMKLLGAVKELSDKNTALVERVAALESN